MCGVGGLVIHLGELTTLSLSLSVQEPKKQRNQQEEVRLSKRNNESSTLVQGHVLSSKIWREFSDLLRLIYQEENSWSFFHLFAPISIRHGACFVGRKSTEDVLLDSEPRMYFFSLFFFPKLILHMSMLRVIKCSKCLPRLYSYSL